MPGLFFFGGTGCSAWLRLAKPASGQQGGVIQSGAGNRTPKRCREKRCPVFKSFALGQGIEKGLPPLAKGSPDFALLQFSGKNQKGLSRAGFPGSLAAPEAGKEFTRGDDWPLAGLFFVLKTEATVNREVVFLAGSPPASWHFINQ